MMMKHESCPELYTCQKVKMTPMIRVLLRCTAAEAMESICTNCESERTGSDNKDIFTSSYGQEIAVVVADETEQAEKTLVGT